MKLREILNAMHIIEFPNPALKNKSVPVTLFNESLRALVDNMFMTMYEAGGIGLSAIQVGHPIRLFIMSTDNIITREEIFINPEITAASETTVKTYEGCLSFPTAFGHVTRSAEISIRAQDLDGNEFSSSLTGLRAVCFQHELDHLDGIVFYDHLGYVQKRKVETRLKIKLGSVI